MLKWASSAPQDLGLTSQGTLCPITIITATLFCASPCASVIFRWRKLGGTCASLMTLTQAAANDDFNSGRN